MFKWDPNLQLWEIPKGCKYTDIMETVLETRNTVCAIEMILNKIQQFELFLLFLIL